MGDGDVDPFCTSVSVEDARARACRCDARACPGVCVRERVISRTPEEWEYSDPITGIGLGVLPVRPYTPRRSSLTTTPPLVPRVPPSTTWSLASGHSRGLANAGNNPTSALEVCGITILGRRPGGITITRVSGCLSGGRVEVVRLAGESTEPSTRATIAVSPGPTSHRLKKSRRRRTSIDGRITGRISQGGCLESRRLDGEDKWMNEQTFIIGCGLHYSMPGRRGGMDYC